MKHAQVSVEYLLVVAFTATILIGGAYFIYSEALLQPQKVDDAQLQRFANTLLFKAGEVVTGGAGTRTTFSERLPQGVTFILVNESSGMRELLFGSSSGTYAYSTSVPLNVTLFGTSAGGGIKRVHVESYLRDGEPLVLATFDARCAASTDYDLNNDCSVDAADVAIVTSCLGRQRPARTWDDAWYTCYRADYDGNCSVTAYDEAELSARIGQQVC